MEKKILLPRYQSQFCFELRKNDIDGDNIISNYVYLDLLK